MEDKPCLCFLDDKVLCKSFELDDLKAKLDINLNIVESKLTDLQKEQERVQQIIRKVKEYIK